MSLNNGTLDKALVKIIAPVIGVFFCIAFLEINLPGIHQTWNDSYDTYLTPQPFNDTPAPLFHPDLTVPVSPGVGITLSFVLFIVLCICNFTVFSIHINLREVYLKYQLLRI